MKHVVIGMDPHKRSVTIEVITGAEQRGGNGFGWVEILRVVSVTSALCRTLLRCEDSDGVARGRLGRCVS